MNYRYTTAEVRAGGTYYTKEGDKVYVVSTLPDQHYVVRSLSREDKSMFIIELSSFGKPPTLQQKFQKWRETHGIGHGKTYWEGLELIAEAHYKGLV